MYSCPSAGLRVMGVYTVDMFVCVLLSVHVFIMKFSCSFNSLLRS